MIADLLDLSPAEQAKIKAALAQFSGNTDQEQLSGSVDPAVNTVWAVVVRMADARGITLPPAGVVVRNRHYSKLVAHCKGVLKFVGKFQPKNRTERSLAVDLCVESVFRHMAERMSYLPISIKTLTDQLGNVSQAVDYQLPGYASAGLLHVAISGLRAI